MTLELGWEEWVSLPKLGLPAMKAKVDTGARSSSLHAFTVEPFGPPSKLKVRFGVHPIPERPDIEVYCSADVLDRRDVTSSNGETEKRWTIETDIEINGERWPIILTLTDREGMNFHMLLGRQALEAYPGEAPRVSPTKSYVQPVLGYDAYDKMLAKTPQKRALRVAILTKEPKIYSSRRLIEAGEARGHVVETINTSRCYMLINAEKPEVHYDGRALPSYDAVIPRIGASITAYGTAVVRQFETTGAFCVNRSEAISASRDKLYAHQILARDGIGMPTTAFASSPQDNEALIKLIGQPPIILKLLESTQGKGVVLAETKKAAESVISAFRNLNADFLVQEFVKEANGEDIRCLVVGNKVVAAMKRSAAPGEFRSNLHQGGSAVSVRITKQEREVALRAARALGLGFAGVDLLRSENGPKVLEVNSSPGLEGIEKSSKKDVADLVFQHIEKRAASTVKRRRKIVSAA
ncbi:30S ribosomal protein S6--L-glutamate ligase [Parvularcula lutaonensis]|uniref:Probable alpha-L-glutamate ligase n=1 Tax=Parvularcula lutaonensis TaxID=491923 RepID=A0ABV7MF47_9PROT|nr:30S ribosomal protein S6--L-glutamate ligase [Parvularcula lutaonensis]GGY52125.1 alpha-L-glutamate ligase [Parvularcula lutaonensis]